MQHTRSGAVRIRIGIIETNLDPPVTVAVAVGAVFSLLLLPDWLFPSYEKRPSRARQVEELTQMLLHGVSGRARHPER